MTNNCWSTRVGKQSLCSVTDTPTSWEKIGKNKEKFYLSPTVCQHVVVHVSFRAWLVEGNGYESRDEL